MQVALVDYLAPADDHKRVGVGTLNEVVQRRLPERRVDADAPHFRHECLRQDPHGALAGYHGSRNDLRRAKQPEAELGGILNILPGTETVSRVQLAVLGHRIRGAGLRARRWRRCNGAKRQGRQGGHSSNKEQVDSHDKALRSVDVVVMRDTRIAVRSRTAKVPDQTAAQREHQFLNLTRLSVASRFAENRQITPGKFGVDQLGKILEGLGSPQITTVDEEGWCPGNS